jgi:hypothetical protein
MRLTPARNLELLLTGVLATALIATPTVAVAGNVTGRTSSHTRITAVFSDDSLAQLTIAYTPVCPDGAKQHFTVKFVPSPQLGSDSGLQGQLNYPGHGRFSGTFGETVSGVFGGSDTNPATLTATFSARLTHGVLKGTTDGSYNQSGATCNTHHLAFTLHPTKQQEV